ncbi:hypothetical protein NADFUDRAFT_48938, partial [Nadsonia fulvescens var. elongata DSM 6958]
MHTYGISDDLSYNDISLSNVTEKGYDSHEVMIVEVNSSTQVKRNLKVRHISMISLGGTIGTGLFFSSAGALADAGPVNALIAYLFMATIVFSVAQSL